MSVVLLTRAIFLRCVILCYFLVILVRLSVPVQVIDSVERLLSEMTYNVLMGTLNHTLSLTHVLFVSLSLSLTIVNKTHRHN